jgi:hypothetical protein
VLRRVSPSGSPGLDDQSVDDLVAVGGEMVGVQQDMACDQVV